MRTSLLILFLSRHFSNNVKLMGIEETEINGSGPLISDSDINALIKLRSLTQRISLFYLEMPRLNSYNFIRLLGVVLQRHPASF